MVDPVSLVAVLEGLLLLGAGGVITRHAVLSRRMKRLLPPSAERGRGSLDWESKARGRVVSLSWKSGFLGAPAGLRLCARCRSPLTGRVASSGTSITRRIRQFGWATTHEASHEFWPKGLVRLTIPSRDPSPTGARLGFLHPTTGFHPKSTDQFFEILGPFMERWSPRWVMLSPGSVVVDVPPFRNPTSQRLAALVDDLAKLSEAIEGIPTRADEKALRQLADFCRSCYPPQGRGLGRAIRYLHDEGCSWSQSIAILAAAFPERECKVKRAVVRSEIGSAHRKRLGIPLKRVDDLIRRLEADEINPQG